MYFTVDDVVRPYSLDKTRSSATAERQRVSYTRLLGSLTDRALHWAPHLFYNYIIDYSLSRIDTISQQTVRHTHFKLNRTFKVIQGHPYWCRQESRMVCYRNVQLIPTLFLKLTKIRQRENGKFVDFNDLTHVWRRPSKKRLRISTNDLYCQKLQLLTYIFVADSMGLRSLVFT